MHECHKPHALELEQWLLGEQTAVARARTESRLTDVERVQLRQGDQALRARLLEVMPSARFDRNVRLRLEAQNPARPRAASVYAMGAAVALLAALLVVMRGPSPEQMGPAASLERAKGAG